MPSNKATTLSPKQSHAVELIAQGHSITDVAKALSVQRQTVSNWRNHNTTFSEAIVAAQEDLITGNRMALIATHATILRNVAELASVGTHRDRRNMIAMYFDRVVRPEDIERFNNPQSPEDALIARALNPVAHDAIN